MRPFTNASSWPQWIKAPLMLCSDWLRTRLCSTHCAESHLSSQWWFWCVSCRGWGNKWACNALHLRVWVYMCDFVRFANKQSRCALRYWILEEVADKEACIKSGIIHNGPLDYYKMMHTWGGYSAMMVTRHQDIVQILYLKTIIVFLTLKHSCV